MKRTMLPGGQLGEVLVKAVKLNGEQRLKGLVVLFENEGGGLAYTLSIAPGVGQRLDFVGAMASASACAQRWNDEQLPGDET